MSKERMMEEEGSLGFGEDSIEQYLQFPLDIHRQNLREIQNHESHVRRYNPKIKASLRSQLLDQISHRYLEKLDQQLLHLSLHRPLSIQLHLNDCVKIIELPRAAGISTILLTVKLLFYSARLQYSLLGIGRKPEKKHYASDSMALSQPWYNYVIAIISQVQWFARQRAMGHGSFHEITSKYLPRELTCSSMDESYQCFTNFVEDYFSHRFKDRRSLNSSIGTIAEEAIKDLDGSFWTQKYKLHGKNDSMKSQAANIGLSVQWKEEVVKCLEERISVYEDEVLLCPFSQNLYRQFVPSSRSWNSEYSERKAKEHIDVLKLRV